MIPSEWKTPKLVEILPSINYYKYGLFLCFCGKEFRARRKKNNKCESKSCGCYKRWKIIKEWEKNWEEKTGLKLLKIVSCTLHTGRGLFLCFCGNTFEAYLTNIKWGRSKSCGCVSKLVRGQSDNEIIYKRHVNGSAISRNLECTLTFDEFIKLVYDNCAYCGMSPDKLLKRYKKNPERNTTYYNGIDRKDNSIGYTKENCVTCCSTCNYMKHVMDPTEFINHIERIYEHRIRNKKTSTKSTRTTFADYTRISNPGTKSRQEQTRVA